MRIFSFVSLIALLAGSSVSPAFAQTQGTGANTDEIVITATRAPAPREKVGSALTVIDAQTLQARQAVAVVDVLSDQAGVLINRNGGLGSVTSVRMRGAESEQTVVLIDGVKINDPASPGGGFDFGNLMVGDLARIEVLRGPQSTLYGSAAIGGVINLVTAQRFGEPSGALDVEFGEQGYGRVRVDVAGGDDGLSYGVAGLALRTDGFSAFDPRLGGREKDGYENQAFSARVRAAVGANMNLEGRMWQSQGRVDLDGFPAPAFSFADTPERSEIDERIVYLGATHEALDGRLITRASVARTEIERVNLDPTISPQVTFASEGQTDRFEVQSTFDVTPQFQLVGGYDEEIARLRTRAPSPFDPNPPTAFADIRLRGVYAQAQVQPTDGLTATLGVRQTRNSRFGEAVNLRATLAYSPNDGATIVRASLGDGFKAPTPFQTQSDFGNPGLAPEEAVAFDIGVEQSFFDGALQASATYFERDARNQIDFISCFANPNPICIGRPFGVYDNVAKTSAQGVEVAVAWRPMDDVVVNASFTSLDARNRARETAAFNRFLPRRPESNGAVSVAYKFGDGHDIGVSATYVGDSFDNAANTVRLKSYTVVSVRGSLQVSPTVSLFGRVENVGDALSQSAFGYGSAPRQAVIGVRVRL